MRWVWAGRMMMAAAAVGVGNCAYAAHYYRPVPDYADGSTKATRRRLLDVADEVGVEAASARLHVLHVNMHVDWCRHTRVCMVMSSQ